MCEFLQSVRLVFLFSLSLIKALLETVLPKLSTVCFINYTMEDHVSVLFFLRFRMSFVFSRYSSISFFVVGIAPNKGTLVSVTNALSFNDLPSGLELVLFKF